jgi:hypothetical protein
MTLSDRLIAGVLKEGPDSIPGRALRDILEAVEEAVPALSVLDEMPDEVMHSGILAAFPEFTHLMDVSDRARIVA